MSKELRDCWPLLLLIEKSRPAVRRAILVELSDDATICKVFREIFINLNNGNIKLEGADKKLVDKKRSLCKSVACLNIKPKSRIIRRKVLVQVGGILPLVVAALAPLVGKLFEKIVE